MMESVEGSEKKKSSSGGSMDINPNILDRYKLHRIIGHGAYGTVWLELNLDAYISIKTL